MNHKSLIESAIEKQREASRLLTDIALITQMLARNASPMRVLSDVAPKKALQGLAVSYLQQAAQLEELSEEWAKEAA